MNRFIATTSLILLILIGSGCGEYNPSQPIVAGAMQSIVNSYDFMESCTDVDVQGDYAYATIDNGGLCIFNISDPQDFYLKTKIEEISNGVAIDVSGDYAYVADKYAGLYIIKINPLQSAQIVAVIDPPGNNPTDVAVSGDYAYVTDLNMGLQIIDITPPESASVVAGIVTPGGASGVAISGNYAYVSAYRTGLQVIKNVNPPDSPYIVATVSADREIEPGKIIAGSASCVTISGDNAYVGKQLDGVMIVDISDPEKAFKSGEISGMGTVSVEVWGEYLYAGFGYWGLRIINISNLSVVGSLDTNGMCQGSAMKDNYLYLADGIGGLKVVDLQSTLRHLPTYNFSRVWGATGNDYANEVITDSQGNFYITGTFSGMADLDPGPGEDWRSATGNDIYVSKFGADGILIWTRTFPGTGIWDEGHGLAVDVSGNVYVTGFFSGSIDFGSGSQSFICTSNGGSDIFVSKYDSYGNFLGAFSWGGPNDDKGFDIVVDSYNNIYVTGFFKGTADFKPGIGKDIRISNGGSDIFISKFDYNGNYVWTKTSGGQIDDVGYGLDIVNSANILLTGTLNDDLFLNIHNTQGQVVNRVLWTADGHQIGYKVVHDVNGNIFITGSFEGSVDFNPDLVGSNFQTSMGGEDVFLIKLTQTCDYAWAKTFGGLGIWDEGHGLAIDVAGNIYITGMYEGVVDFDPGIGEDWHTSNGSTDIFLCKFDASGSFKWSQAWGGDEKLGIWDEGHGLAIDVSGNLFITGRFMGTVDFDPSISSDIHESISESDVFLVKYLP